MGSKDAAPTRKIFTVDAIAIVDICSQYAGKYIQNIYRPVEVLQIKPYRSSSRDALFTAWDARKKRHQVITAHDLAHYGFISEEQAKEVLRMDSSALENALVVQKGSPLAEQASQSQPLCTAEAPGLEGSTMERRFLQIR